MSSAATVDSPKVLLVEDNPGDVRLVQELLKEGGFRVALTVAESGTEAVEYLQDGTALPDAIITDLQMPGMNGLELVEHVQRNHPAVPVILMTAYGSEEVAIRALQEGAASYVPKKQLALELARTLGRVIEVARATASRERLIECLVQVESQFVLQNDPALVGSLVNHLEENLTRMGFCDETARLQVGMALHEALDNAIFHGNLEISSDQREIDDHRYYELAEIRRNQSPYRDRRVYLTARESRRRIVYVIRDEGPGFEVAALPDPTDAANLDKVSGRGLLLIRTFMDEMYHNEAGNQITIVKRCEC